IFAFSTATNIPLSTSNTHLLSATFFFFNDTAPTEIYTLSLHDALPICRELSTFGSVQRKRLRGSLHGGSRGRNARAMDPPCRERSEEHTSELQSRGHLVCRLLLEKKKKKKKNL